MKLMSEAAKGMAKTIEYMNEHGWCKSLLQNSLGETCVRGAFLEANGDAMFYIDVFGALDSASKELYPERVGDNWGAPAVLVNDHPDTTRADVDKVMQRALVLLIQEGATS